MGRPRMLRLALMISVVGRVKRGGESTTIGLVSYLGRHAEVRVLAGGPFPHDRLLDLGFPALPRYQSLYERLPTLLKHRIVRRLHLDPLSVRNFLFCRRALACLRGDPPDLAVFRSVGPWGAKAGRSLRRTHQVPFVTIEGGWKTGERETARYHPNLHIAVNVEVADYLRTQLPAVKIAHIPNGIRVADFAPQGDKAAVDLPRPLFLGCGALDEVKRFHLTIRAVHRLGRGSLLLLGKGPSARALEAYGREVLGDRFRLASVPYEAMVSYYRAADVVTVPSSGESFGMVYLEAMACNRPVVATRDKNRRIIVGEAGELVDPLDEKAYAAALERCSRTDYGNLPREQALKFDWAVVGPRYLAALEAVAGEAGHSRRSYPVYRRMGRRERAR